VVEKFKPFQTQQGERILSEG